VTDDMKPPTSRVKNNFNSFHSFLSCIWKKIHRTERCG
jgi:hypothetical protein